MQGLVKRLLFGGLAGKVLGVLRELVAAWCFGTGLVANAYRLAQAAFLLPLQGLVSDSINGAFTPHYARLRSGDPAAAQILFVAMQGLLLIVSIAVSVALVFRGGWLVALMAPGFTPDARKLTTEFVTVLAVALPPYVLVGLYGATELVHGQGRLVAARASVQSCGLLVGTVAAWAFNWPLLIAVGFVASYAFLLIWAISVTRGLGLKMTAKIGSTEAWIVALKPIAKVFLILIWVPLSLQISQVVERRLASGINPNAIAALDYARFITETLLILIAMPFGVAGQAAMPTMQEVDFRREAQKSTALLIIVGLPLSTFIWAHSETIVTLLFRRGAFNAESVRVTSQILGANAIGIVFLLVAYAGQKFLNARGQNIVVLRSTVLGVLASITCNLTLSNFLGVTVLGFAATLSGLVMMISVLFALQLVRPVWQKTWTWWLFALIHVSAISVWRAIAPAPWWMELVAAIFLWMVALFGVPSHRRMIAQLLGAIKRRGV